MSHTALKWIVGTLFVIICGFVGYKVAKACEYITEPTCEELNTCEPVDTCESEEGIQENGCTPVEGEPVIVPEEPKKETPKGNLKISQGPNGHLGDGCFQAEWKKFKGYDKVVAKYVTDLDGLVFKNATKVKWEDDGAQTVCVPGAKKLYIKLKPNDDDAEYSSVLHRSI